MDDPAFNVEFKLVGPVTVNAPSTLASPVTAAEESVDDPAFNVEFKLVGPVTVNAPPTVASPPVSRVSSKRKNFDVPVTVPAWRLSVILACST